MAHSKANYKFDFPKMKSSIIKAIGVGGGGSNALNHMYDQGIEGVEFVVCNTDMQALNSSPVPYKLPIGVNLTEGLGCGANPEIGRDAALESKDQICEMLEDTKMVFITAGMGGGTGTGAAPVLAQIAKDMDILTVGIVTVPFAFEGKKKLAQAKAGIEELRRNCDTVLIILNDKLREVYGNLSIAKAFAEADTVLTTAAKGIAEIITLVGYVNVDFQDVRAVMHNAGAAVMGSAETAGEERAVLAAKQALSSPLLDNYDIMGAKRVLLTIVSGQEEELQMDELTQITEYIQHQAGKEAEVIFGHGIDPNIGASIRVTVIATDFGDKRVLEEGQEFNEIKKRNLEKQADLFSDIIDNSVNSNDTDVTLKNFQNSTTTHTDDDVPRSGLLLGVSAPSPSQSNGDDENNGHQNHANSESEEYVPNDTIYRNGIEQTIENTTHQYDMQANRKVSSEEESIVRTQTKERLQKMAEERRKELHDGKKIKMTKEELDEKWSLPAYLRRNVKMAKVPRSHESNISRYNLNDDNNILGDNKFLHDNVD